MPDTVNSTYSQSIASFMRQLFWVILLSFILTGCAGVQTQTNYKKGNHPGLNTKSTASVGQVMVSEYDYMSQESAVIQQELKGSFWFGRRRVDAGTTLVKTSSGNNDMYCKTPVTNGTTCLNDEDNDGRFDRAYTINNYGALANGDRINPTSYQLTDTIAGNGFKYELIYQGMEGNVAKVAYREYSQDLARPAYSQDISYTIEKEDTEITFRDLRIVIHSISNNAVEYTVLSGL